MIELAINILFLSCGLLMGAMLFLFWVVVNNKKELISIKQELEDIQEELDPEVEICEN